MKLHISDVRGYINGNEGYCSTCDEFTNGGVEPDAQGYKCDECDENTVMGAELAIVILELIDIIED